MSANLVPAITCEKCSGSGKVPLHEHLAETLGKIPACGAVAENVQSNGITQNAVSNRLADLLALGLVIRQREGKFWRYFHTPTGTRAIKQAKKARV